MSEVEARIAGEPIGADGWTATWVDRAAGIVRLVGPTETCLAAVEGNGRAWFVTIRGRRIEVDVATWRQRMLAEAEEAGRDHDGPVVVRATLPGLVVAIGVSTGDDVEAGAALLTIEAMKMQNEVRAPRGGRVVEVSVQSGQAVATGVVLLRIE